MSLTLLPNDALELIARRLSFPGVRAFEATCRAFRSLVVQRGLWQQACCDAVIGLSRVQLGAVINQGGDHSVKRVCVLELGGTGSSAKRYDSKWFFPSARGAWPEHGLGVWNENELSLCFAVWSLAFVGSGSLKHRCFDSLPLFLK